MRRNRASGWLLVLLAITAASASIAFARSGRASTGTLVIKVVYAGGLTADGTVQQTPGAHARITIAGQGRTLHVRADAKGSARTSLRPGRYRVSIPSTASSSSRAQTAVVRANRTTTTRLTSVCNTC